MIRRAAPADVVAIEPLDPFAGDRRREAAEHRLLVWVANDQAVGYITTAAESFHGHPYIQFLWVHPDWRRRGIATRLMDYVEQHHIGQRVFISTESSNTPMLELLRRRGYSLAGALAGLNADGSDEVFYFNDFS